MPANVLDNDKLARTIKVAKRGKLLKGGRKPSQPRKRRAGMSAAATMNLLGGGA